MNVRVQLPDLFFLYKGKRKKEYAWAYLQTQYPGYIPKPQQPELDNNILLCEIDFDRERQLSKERIERRAAKINAKKAKK